MKIVVLAGGISTERNVSLVSGKQVYLALKDKHQTILLDSYLGYEGDDYKEVFSLNKEWDAGIEKISTVNPDLEAVKKLRKDNPNVFLGPHVLDICTEADIVFLALHGGDGEGGKIQALFDCYDVKYTGTDFLSSALCMGKDRTKECFMYHGVPTPKSVIVSEKNKYEKAPFLPCVVKACNGGSSIGVYIVKTEAEYQEAMKDVVKFDSTVMIEQFIDGREFTCGVFDGKALPTVEIVPLEGFYDYSNKYQAGSTKEVCPAELSDELTKKMQSIAEDAYRVLGVKCYARFDFLLDKDGEFYCLEGNTLPGMTPISLLPQEAKAVGIEFPELCEKIIEVSLRKYE